MTHPAGTPVSSTPPREAGCHGSFVENVLRAVDAIPPGMVATYGDIARAVGSRAPRAVGRVLALHGSSTHWWRVIPASGLPPSGHEAAALEHYLAEGTPLRSLDPGFLVVRKGHPAGFRVVFRLARFTFPGDEELPPLPRG